MSTNPYSGLPDRQFWRRAVAGIEPFLFDPVTTPRFTIGREERVATAGSCFAQHIGRQFKTRGYQFVDVEPAPEILGVEDQHAFGYDLSPRLVAGLLWTLPQERANELPTLVARGAGFSGEARAFAPEVIHSLSALGIQVRPGAGENSGLHGVALRDGVLEGAADPRREGTAAPLR